ncbi:hypothetical protein FOL47_008256 [Perkinsus chesapeaki]|uniref:Uncharacterized protein n=1 Tax=Perkinsus chesapeaki TaxID=330153 RepID=A0A7J6MW21_PERCH|nr:hypothetical protein FOL47_008256 [Perkinsus chesapeaki]
MTTADIIPDENALTEPSTMEDISTPVVPVFKEGQTRLAITLNNAIVTDEELISLRGKIKLSVEVLGTSFDGTIVESQEEEETVSDDEEENPERENDNTNPETAPRTYHEIIWQPNNTVYLVKDPSFRKRLLMSIDSTGYIPVFLKLMMTDDFEEEVKAMAGNKGAIEVEEMAKRVEDMIEKCSRTVLLDSKQFLKQGHNRPRHSTASVRFPLKTEQSADEGPSSGLIKLAVTVEPSITPALMAVEKNVVKKHPVQREKEDAVEAFRVAVLQIVDVLQQGGEDIKDILMDMKANMLRPAIIRVISEMVDKGSQFYHNMSDEHLEELKSEAFAILSSHLSALLRTPRTPDDVNYNGKLHLAYGLMIPLVLSDSEDAFTTSIRLAWEAEFICHNYEAAAWEYKRQIVINSTYTSDKESLAGNRVTLEGHKASIGMRQMAWMRYSAFLRRLGGQNRMAEHALKEATMLGYNREAMCYLACSLVSRDRYNEAGGALEKLTEAEGMTDSLVNLIKGINLHKQGDLEGCARYIGLSTREKSFFRGMKTEQQIFDKLRLFDGADAGHHEDEDNKNDSQALSEDSPRSIGTSGNEDACGPGAGLYMNLLPPIPTPKLHLTQSDHTTLALLKELVVDNSFHQFADLIGLALRDIRKQIGATSFLSQICRQWCEFHHLVAVSLTQHRQWDRAVEVLERIVATEPHRCSSWALLGECLARSGAGDSKVSEALLKATPPGLQRESTTESRQLRLLAILQYARLLLAKKKWSQARDFLMVSQKDVLASQPTATAWLYISTTYVHQERWVEAKKAISMALSLADTSRIPSDSGQLDGSHPMLHADCWGLMSLVLLRGGPFEEGLRQPRRCFDLYMINEPVNVKLLAELGFAWLSNKIPTLAEAAASRALEIEASGDGSAHWLYGCALCEQGMIQRGVLELQTAIGLLWDNEVARNEIVAACVKYIEDGKVSDPPLLESVYAANKVAQSRQDESLALATA